MPVDLRETRLPGVGTKFTFRLDDGGRLAVIQHNDGKRELYFFRHADDEEPRAVIRLDDDEARQLGAVLGGAYERPKIVEDLEMALGELLIEWEPVPDTSPWIGKTLAESGFRANTGITVIAILREPEPVTGRATARRDPAGRHARHRRQGRAVLEVPPAARRRRRTPELAQVSAGAACEALARALGTQAARGQLGTPVFGEPGVELGTAEEQPALHLAMRHLAQVLAEPAHRDAHVVGGFGRVHPRRAV